MVKTPPASEGVCVGGCVSPPASEGEGVCIRPPASEGVCMCMLSCVQLFATPGTVALQASLSMEFSRQEYWSGLSFPSPGDHLLDTETELWFPRTASRFFTI